MTKYQMTAGSNSEIGTWETCRAATLTAAKREATARYGAGYNDLLIQIAEGDNISEPRVVIAQRRNTDTRWTDCI